MRFDGYAKPSEPAGMMSRDLPAASRRRLELSNEARERIRYYQLNGVFLFQRVQVNKLSELFFLLSSK